MEFRVIVDISFDLSSVLPRVAVRDGPKASTWPLVRLCHKQNYSSQLYIYFFQTAPFYEYIEHKSCRQGSKNRILVAMLRIFQKFLQLHQGTKINVSRIQHYGMKGVHLVLNCGRLFTLRIL